LILNTQSVDARIISMSVRHGSNMIQVQSVERFGCHFFPQLLHVFNLSSLSDE